MSGDRTCGQVAFEAYQEHVHDSSVVSGLLLVGDGWQQSWEDLDPLQQSAWEEAADAVRQELDARWEPER
jgi:hypothetical protein